ncbi:ABC transporter ATP-binding protein [Terrirubrum flagellatum]|uniref:ABC transporter ATP-binding protein n=1 Tax=Terrirubrum flagellatum TaxID=2895980 RepID=UPI003CC82D82
MTSSNGRVGAGEHGALLDVDHLSKTYHIRRGFLFSSRAELKAVQDVSFQIQPGEVLGLVGESGSGKTSVGRCVLRLEDATAGEVRFKGRNIHKLDSAEMRAVRKSMQVVFQDPYASLNPRLTVRETLSQSLNIHGMSPGREREPRLRELVSLVGLPAAYLDRYPHEFSGGQRQRIGIARALSVKPQFIVADEAVSALDVSVRAQIINLLQELRKSLGLAMLFISHDLAIVEYISDRVAVMYLGKIMEIAKARDIYRDPKHPYTKALLSAAPTPDPTRKRKRTILRGDIPSPINPPEGCVFRTRCPIASEECRTISPRLLQVGVDHFAACIKL